MGPTSIAILIVGLVALVAGAEFLVRGASRLAARTGMSSVVIGLTVVAFGTSAPELAVSVGDALRGGPEAGSIAIGNVVGSNIANILLVLGTAAAVGGSLFVAQRIVRLDVPIMIGASVLLLVFVLNESLSRVEGVVFLLLLAVYLTWTVITATRGSAPDIVTEYDEALDPEALAKASVLSDIGFLVLGLVLLVFGSQALVSSASDIATDLGVSDLVIGLTVVAIGTSLPEVATSVLAAIRGQRDLAVGNAIGSNLFNLLAVLGVTAVVSPNAIPVRCQRRPGRHPRHDRRGGRVPADLRQRPRAQPLGGHRVPVRLRGLPRLVGTRRDRARHEGFLRQRRALLRGADRGDHDRGALVPGTWQRSRRTALIAATTVSVQRHGPRGLHRRCRHCSPSPPPTIGVLIEIEGSH